MLLGSEFNIKKGSKCWVLNFGNFSVEEGVSYMVNEKLEYE